MNDIEKLFEENRPLVGWTIKNKIHNIEYVLGTLKMEFEDIYQIGLMTLFQVCKSFDPSKNMKFSNLAVKAITNNIITMLKRAQRRKSVEQASSLSEETSEGLTLEDMLSVECAELQEYEHNEVREQFLKRLEKKLKPNELKVLEYLTQDRLYTIQEISDLSGIARTTVFWHIQNIREKGKWLYKRIA